MINKVKTIINRIKRENKKRKWNNSVANTAKSCGEKLYVNEYSAVTANTVLGNNVHLNGLIVSGDGEAVIGNNFFCGNHVRIFTENHNVGGEYLPYDEKRIYKKVIIEDNVWCGEGVKILPGAIVHEGVIIQAGAVVSGEIPRCSYIGGNPAKPFKMRNIEHYDKLKRDNKFFYCN